MDNDLDTQGARDLKMLRAFREKALRILGIDPFLCPQCGFPEITQMSHDDRPYLECLSCDTKYYPGRQRLDWYSDLTRN